MQVRWDFKYAFNCKFTNESSNENFFCKSVKIWQNYGHVSVAPFLAHPVLVHRMPNLRRPPYTTRVVSGGVN